MNDAEHLLAQLSLLDPLSKETRCFELEVVLKRRDLSRAERLASELLAHFPDSTHVLFLSGQAKFLQKNYLAAIALFRETFRLNPKPIMEWWLGRTLLRSGDRVGARAALENVEDRVSYALLDIAWLEELEGNIAASIKYYERFLKLFPENDFAKSALARVKALRMDALTLREELDSSEQWGDSPPKHLVAAYLKQLLEAGEIAKAREYIADNTISSEQTIDIGWLFYKAHAFDTAFELFRRDLASNVNRFTVLNAFESAAAKCSRLTEAIAFYEKLAVCHKSLFGRIIRLRKRLDNDRRRTKSLLRIHEDDKAT